MTKVKSRWPSWRRGRVGCHDCILEFGGLLGVYAEINGNMSFWAVYSTLICGNEWNRNK